jgi:hypothetical protein
MPVCQRTDVDKLMLSAQENRIWKLPESLAGGEDGAATAQVASCRVSVCADADGAMYRTAVDESYPRWMLKEHGAKADSQKLRAVVPCCTVPTCLTTET